MAVITHTEQQTPYARILAALEPFALSVVDKEKMAAAIMKQHMRFKGEKGLIKSDNYLDFRGKADAMLRSFAQQGLTEEDYLSAAKTDITLLTRSPTTMRDNVRDLVTRFRDEGLTIKQYLKIVLKDPQLFTLSPDNVESHIRGLVEGFAAQGLTVQQVFEAAANQPILHQDHNRLIYNIHSVAEALKGEGLTVDAYLAAALKQPALFCKKPASMIPAFQRFIKLYDDGLLAPSENAPQATAEHPHAPVISMLLNNPTFLNLAADNIAQREVLARVNDCKINAAFMYVVKPQVTEALDCYVAHLNHPLGEVPSTTVRKESVEMGEKLLIELAHKKGALDPDLAQKVIAKSGPIRA